MNPKKIDLELCLATLKLLHKRPHSYEELRKGVARITMCGSPGRVSRAIKAMAMNGWIVKSGPPGTRAPYQITEKGILLLKSINKNFKGDEKADKKDNKRKKEFKF